MKSVIEKIFYRLNSLKKIKMNDKEYMRELEYLEICLSPQKGKDFPILLRYNHMNDIFDSCGLNRLEKGYIFSRVLERNISIIYSEPYSLIDYEKYQNQFHYFGIYGQEIINVCDDYISNKKAFAYSFPFLDEIKSTFDDFVNSDDLNNILCVLASFSIKRANEEINLLAKCFNSKSKEIIEKNMDKSDILMSLERTLVKDLHMPKEQAREILSEYLVDNTFMDYKQKLFEKLKIMLEKIKEYEENERNKQMLIFSSLFHFVQKDKRDIFDYQAIGSLLPFQVPIELVESYLYYYMELDTKVSEKKLSAKQIKNELKKFYDEKKGVPFDYHNFGELISLLQKSNYTEEVLIRILRGVWNNHIENDAYYAYLYAKNRGLNSCQNTVDDASCALELICCCTEKEWNEYNDEAVKILRSLDPQIWNYEKELGLILKKDSIFYDVTKTSTNHM